MGTNRKYQEILVDGILCDSTAEELEQALNQLDGVFTATVSYLDAKASVSYDAERLDDAAFRAVFQQFGCTVREKRNNPKQAAKNRSTALKGAKNNGPLVTETIKIQGMTCTGCETRIENCVTSFAGVRSVQASYARSSMRLTYDPSAANLQKIFHAIEKLGYTVETTAGKKQRNAGKQAMQNEQIEPQKFVGIGILLLAVYMLINRTVGFNFIPEVTQNMGYGILFLVGMVTSIHCVAMCGGINLSQCVSSVPQGQEESRLQKLRPSLLYNAGRVLSYTIVGGVVGGLGSVVQFSGAAKGIVVILSGVFMVIMGLNMLGIFPQLRKFMPHMPKAVAKKMYNGKKRGPFIVGMLNGFMPCGPLQAMQIYALGTGSALAGAASMLFFSLGTVPLMFGLGALSSFMSSKFTHKMMRVSAMLVVVLGVVMANRGFALSGISVSNLLPPLSTGANAETSANAAVVQDGVQVINTTMEGGRYPAITVQKGIPVKWIFQADAGSLNGCNQALQIPQYNITKSLEVGENEIEFTPDESGTIPYSCWMGMVRSTITVVDDLSAAPAAVQAAVDNTGTAAGDLGALGGAGGCCENTPAAFANGKVPTEKIGIAKVDGKQQTLIIRVDEQGYSPAVLVAQQGIPLTIQFETGSLNSCVAGIEFPEFNGRLDLTTQKETPVITPEADFTFQCTMGMLHGYVKVVPDVNKVDLDEVRNTVSNYDFSAVGGGAAGCCG